MQRNCSFSAEARRGAGHRTLLVWLSSREPSSLPWDRDHRYCALTPTLASFSLAGQESSSEAPPLGSEAKGWLMWCTGCLLYSRCDQWQLDAMIACQCPLARLVTLEVDRSLWRDSNSSVIRRDSEWPTEREPSPSPRFSLLIITLRCKICLFSIFILELDTENVAKVCRFCLGFVKSYKVA